MYVRTLTAVMVGNKVINKGDTALTNKSEGSGLVARGYAVEVDSLDDVEPKPKLRRTKKAD